MAPGLPHARGPPGGGAFLPRHLRRGRLHRPAGAGSVPSETRVSPRGEGLTPFGSGSRRALSRVPENWALLSPGQLFRLPSRGAECVWSDDDALACPGHDEWHQELSSGLLFSHCGPLTQ